MSRTTSSSVPATVSKRANGRCRCPGDHVCDYSVIAADVAAIRLALLLSIILAPVTAMALTSSHFPTGQRLAGVGFGLPAWRALVLAVVVPAVVVALSCASGRSRCHQHPKAGPGQGLGRA